MAQTENENQGYKIGFKLLKIQSIKPRQAGSFKNDEGEEIDYGYAVKFKTIRVEEVEDEDYGTKDEEFTFEIEVPCDTMSETVIVNDHLKAMKKSKKTYDIEIVNIRAKGSNGSAKTVLHAKDFINEYKL